jgi:hypothetical protein
MPRVVSAPTAGLDMSWGIALLMAAEKSLTFGSQIVWTYGPAAFLDGNLYMYHGLWRISIITSLLFHFFFLALLLHFLTRSLPQGKAGRAARVLLAVVIVLLTAPFLLTHDRILLSAAMLLYLGYQRAPGPLPLFGCGVAGSFVAIASLIKLPCFYIGLVMILVFGGLESRRKGWAYGFTLFLSYLLTLILVWKLCGQELRLFSDFLRYGWEISRGYVDAMGLPGPPPWKRPWGCCAWWASPVGSSSACWGGRRALLS